jgi:hypothetical protein
MIRAEFILVIFTLAEWIQAVKGTELGGGIEYGVKHRPLCDLTVI